MTKNFKIIGDGVVLEFYKAFDAKSKGLKIKLWKWFDSCFKFTRCDFNKELSHFRVFYKDSQAFKLQDKLLQFYTDKLSHGIDLTIKLQGNLISKPALKFVGNEFICDFTGLTEFIYRDFFTTEVKSITQSVSDTARIKSIVEYGKISTKSLIDDIMTEWQDPVPHQYLFKEGAIK